MATLLAVLVVIGTVLAFQFVDVLVVFEDPSMQRLLGEPFAYLRAYPASIVGYVVLRIVVVLVFVGIGIAAGDTVLQPGGASEATGTAATSLLVLTGVALALAVLQPLHVHFFRRMQVASSASSDDPVSG